MRRPLVTTAIVASLAAMAVPLATSAGVADRASSGPSTTEAKTVDTTASTSDPSEFDPEGLVDAAQAGYATLISNYPVGEAEEYVLADCPWMTPTELVASVAPIGDAAHLVPEIRTTLEVESDEDDDGEDGGSTANLFITCDTEEFEETEYEEGKQATGPVYGVGIGAFDYSGTPELMGDLAEFVDTVEGGVVVEPSTETLGGTLYGYCEPGDEDLPEGATSCYQFWFSDLFAVGMYVITDDSNAAALGQLESIVIEQLTPLLQRIAAGIAPVDIVSTVVDDETVVDVTITVAK